MQELAKAREHTRVGQTILQESGICDEVQQVALNHHERVTGDGYPRQFIDSEIPLLARMAAICDVYDALTSERPYGRPYHPALALRHMAAWHGQFDRRLFDAFVLAVGVYPVGSLVRLASRRVAVVVAPGDRPLAPRVRVLMTLAGETLPHAVVDLARTDRPDGIVGVEDPRTWQLGGIDDWWLAPLVGQLPQQGRSST